VRFRRFHNRLIVFVLGILILVQAAGFLAVSLAMTRNARSRIQHELTVGGNVFTRLRATRTKQLADAARLLGSDFAFKTAASTDDRATVISALENHQARVGADIMLLVSLDGVLLADTRHPDAGPAPFPIRPLLERAEREGEAASVALVDDRPYQMVAVPLLAPLPIAWICVGFIIDDRVASDLQQLTMLQVSFLQIRPDGSTRLLASTLPPSMRESLLRAPLGPPEPAGTSVSVEMPDGKYVTLISPIGQTADGSVVAVLQRSLADALRPTRRLQLTLLAISLAGLLVSVAAGLMIARRVTRPVQTLVESAQRIEQGDYAHTVPLDQADELGTLARTFNHMTQGLAERDRVRAELERVSRLKRFFSPQVAEGIVSTGDESMLATHRREITVVFCDLRGFTGFSETAEPEEVIGVLREYHEAVGPLIFQFEGTLERFAGDGLMVFFNDPVPCPDPAARAVRMAVAMRQRVRDLTASWQRLGWPLGFGVGIAMGYATLGRIGFEGRFDYAAIGNVTNLASRLCTEADNGQILISPSVYSAVEGLVEAEPVGTLTLKGFARPVRALNVTQLREPAVA
jgi:adenylate cyclase